MSLLSIRRKRIVHWFQREGLAEIRDLFVQVSWARVLVWAALFTAVLFTPLDWSGCGFFRHGAVEFLYFFYVFSWFVVFFALRLRWRLLLLIVTAPLFFLIWDCTEWRRRMPRQKRQP